MDRIELGDGGVRGRGLCFVLKGGTEDVEDDGEQRWWSRSTTVGPCAYRVI